METGNPIAGRGRLPLGRLGAMLHRAWSYSEYAIETAAGNPVFRVVSWLTSSEQSEQLSVNGLTVRCERALPGERSWEQGWEQLCEDAPDATPFQHPAWQRALLTVPQALRRLRLFSLHDRDRLVGIVPLELMRGRGLRLCGGMLSDYLNPLVARGYGDRCWGALLGACQQIVPGQAIVLERLDQSSSAVRDLTACAAGAGYELIQDDDGTVARIALPDTWEAYLASLDRHEAKELKRKINKAERGGAVFTTCRDPQQILSELNELLRLLEASGGGKGRKARWLFPRHFASAAPAMAQLGRLSVSQLIIEGRYAAGLIALPTADGQMLWNTAFDPAMKSWSPGIVLFGMLIREAIAQRKRVIDLLRGEYPYKERLGAVAHPLRRLTLKPAQSGVKRGVAA